MQAGHDVTNASKVDADKRKKVPALDPVALLLDNFPVGSSDYNHFDC